MWLKFSSWVLVARVNRAWTLLRKFMQAVGAEWGAPLTGPRLMLHITWTELKLEEAPYNPSRLSASPLLTVRCVVRWTAFATREAPFVLDMLASIASSFPGTVMPIFPRPRR